MTIKQGKVRVSMKDKSSASYKGSEAGFKKIIDRAVKKRTKEEKRKLGETKRILDFLYMSLYACMSLDVLN